MSWFFGEEPWKLAFRGTSKQKQPLLNKADRGLSSKNIRSIRSIRGQKKKSVQSVQSVWDKKIICIICGRAATLKY